MNPIDIYTVLYLYVHMFLCYSKMTPRQSTQLGFWQLASGTKIPQPQGGSSSRQPKAIGKNGCNKNIESRTGGWLVSKRWNIAQDTFSKNTFGGDGNSSYQTTLLASSVF